MSLKVISVSHGKDLDGLASSAIVTRHARSKGFKCIRYYTEPYLLHKALAKTLKHEGPGELVITDLGPNKVIMPRVVGMLKSLRDRGFTVRWLDHHVWDEESLNAVRNVVDQLVIDKSLCAAEIAYKVLNPNDEISRRLAELARDADFWIRRDELSMKLTKVIASGMDRERIVLKLARGLFWDEEFEKAYRERLAVEEKLLARALRRVKEFKVDKLRIAVVLADVPAGLVSEILASRGYDVIAVVSRRGSVSLRRGHEEVDLVPIALALGGGGHPFAAGGTLGYGLLDRLLARLGYYRKLDRIVKAVEAYLRERGDVI